MSVKQNGGDGTREVFRHGLQSTYIRQCLLENVTLDLQTALDQVRNIDVAQKQSESHGPPVFFINSVTMGTREAPREPLETREEENSPEDPDTSTSPSPTTSAGSTVDKCFLCGWRRHP